MSAVHIRIGHDDDFVVAQLADVEIIMDTGAKSSDHSLDLRISIDFIHSCLFYV